VDEVVDATSLPLLDLVKKCRKTTGVLGLVKKKVGEGKGEF